MWLPRICYKLQGCKVFLQDTAYVGPGRMMWALGSPKKRSSMAGAVLRGPGCPHPLGGAKLLAHLLYDGGGVVLCPDS